MMFQAVAIHPAMRHFQGHFSRVHESPSQNMPVRLATRSQADWQNQFRKLLPVQQSPQQKVMTEARRILQHNRQTDPSYAALPAFFGLDEQAQVQFSNPGSQDRNDPRMEQLAVMHGVSTSALQALQHLLPDLCLNAHQNPQLVKALAADTCVIASRLLQLKAWFPSANISKMVADRPALVLGEFHGISAAKAVLHKWFDADAVDHMVQEQPLFLVEDVEDAISSLNRWMSTTNGAHKLQHNPSLLTSLVANRKLSLW